MLDKEKVKLMTTLAFYEQNHGKEDMKINEYYRNDYAGLHIICSTIWVTIGYVCLVSLMIFVQMDFILDNLSKRLLVLLVGGIIAGYVAVAVVYGLISNYLFRRKYRQAAQRIKEFNRKLTKLLGIYEKEKK